MMRTRKNTASLRDYAQQDTKADLLQHKAIVVGNLLRMRILFRIMCTNIVRFFEPLEAHVLKSVHNFLVLRYYKRFYLGYVG